MYHTRQHMTKLSKIKDAKVISSEFLRSSRLVALMLYDHCYII